MSASRVVRVAVTFFECFTIDSRSRTGRTPPLGMLIRRMTFEPGYRAVVYYRISLYLKSVRFPRRLAFLGSRLILMRLNRVPGVEIRTNIPIGEGLSVHHAHDIVIGAGARIGKNVTIFNGVTLGARTLQEEDEEKDSANRYPTIGHGVTIFPGAKIVGAVEIGDNSVVGANSVVNRSFPAESIIAGSPARLIRAKK